MSRAAGRQGHVDQAKKKIAVTTTMNAPHKMTTPLNLKSNMDKDMAAPLNPAAGWVPPGSEADPGGMCPTQGAEGENRPLEIDED